MDMENLVVFSFVGVVFIILGLFMRIKPPKRVNHIYGYRTNRSMKSERMWKEANRYSAAWMIGIGIFYIIIGLFVSRFVSGMEGFGILVGLMLMFNLLLFVVVERRLKELEDKSF
ncbi:SdpI family protein [Paenibacillus provencensis]|uniref:SdpI family protein n=1 Tax=Paenibacillus provencensis TaxID=441151 RepID=A0ABW3Q4A5_9BACL|nr:SdpI family protein [Paenibacillus sp. MER 78]MCM3127467.1 SdpI family protein [Paenibacillus sp. MER 78]